MLLSLLFCPTHLGPANPLRQNTQANKISHRLRASQTPKLADKRTPE